MGVLCIFGDITFKDTFGTVIKSLKLTLFKIDWTLRDTKFDSLDIKYYNEILLLTSPS